MMDLEVLDGGLNNKIQIQWSGIVGLKASYPDDGPGTLVVVQGNLFSSGRQIHKPRSIPYGKQHVILLEDRLAYTAKRKRRIYQQMFHQKSPNFAKLRHLRHLDLSRNYLNGSIRTEWASVRLVGLSTEGNRF